ncbi:MAG TPA: flagellar basal-body rod protein FlgG [Alphaproteobacteria bacterium]|nr:flagellar basal-body rod protein FlgG [Alphaproteobacteria bacterium]
MTLDIGATGMLAQQLNVDVISNNIANMTTTGYKRQRAEFQDLLYQTKVRPGASSSDQGTTVPAGIQQGLGVKAGSVYRINEQGALQMTGNPFDIAIKGEGYYMITLPSGETGYTRDGSFQLDQDGQLVTSEGYDVQPGITIPPDAVDVTVNASGEILVKLQNQTALTNVGQIQLATFANDAGLEAIGNNILMETEASGTAVVSNPGEPGYGQLEQGALETSNVNIVQEITSLIQAQRAYEMNSKIIQTGDEMLSTISNLR